MIVSFEGFMGSGKTTAAVACAVEEAERTGRKIVSNVRINYHNYQYFTLEWFLEHFTDNELEDCILVLDELYQLVDSRNSQQKVNKLMTYFVVQTRKRNVDMFVCTHQLENIDIRLRKNVDIRGAVRFQEELPCKQCKGTGLIYSKQENSDITCPRCLGFFKPNHLPRTTYGGYINIYFLDRRRRKRYPGVPIWGPKFWGLFDTRQKVSIQQKLFTGIDVSEIGASI